MRLSRRVLRQAAAGGGRKPWSSTLVFESCDRLLCATLALRAAAGRNGRRRSVLASIRLCKMGPTHYFLIVDKTKLRKAMAPNDTFSPNAGATLVAAPRGKVCASRFATGGPSSFLVASDFPGPCGGASVALRPSHEPLFLSPFPQTSRAAPPEGRRPATRRASPRPHAAAPTIGPRPRVLNGQQNAHRRIPPGRDPGGGATR